MTEVRHKSIEWRKNWSHIRGRSVLVSGLASHSGQDVGVDRGLYEDNLPPHKVVSAVIENDHERSSHNQLGILDIVSRDGLDFFARLFSSITDEVIFCLFALDFVGRHIQLVSKL